LINIAGSIGNKQDASCLILEQLEIFKNGGPVIFSFTFKGKIKFLRRKIKNEKFKKMELKLIIFKKITNKANENF